MTQINAVNQNILSTTAEKVVGTNQGCSCLILKSLVTNAVVIYIGIDNTVSSSNGFPLSPGEVVVWPAETTDAVYAVAASGTPTLAYAVESKP